MTSTIQSPSSIDLLWNVHQEMVDILQIEVKNLALSYLTRSYNRGWQDKFAVPSFPVPAKHILHDKSFRGIYLLSMLSHRLEHMEIATHRSTSMTAVTNSWLAVRYFTPQINDFLRQLLPQLSQQLKHETLRSQLLSEGDRSE